MIPSEVTFDTARTRSTCLAWKKIEIKCLRTRSHKGDAQFASSLAPLFFTRIHVLYLLIYTWLILQWSEVRQLIYLRVPPPPRSCKMCSRPFWRPSPVVCESAPMEKDFWILARPAIQSVEWRGHLGQCSTCLCWDKKGNQHSVLKLRTLLEWY